MKLLSKVMLGAMFALIISSCKKDAKIPSSENVDAVESVSNSSHADHDSIHFCTVLNPTNSARAASFASKQWRPGTVLTVSMVGATAAIREKVRNYAVEWSNYANISFNFVEPDQPAVIRITFNPGGSYSSIGTDALYIPSNRNTMNFGWLENPRTTEAGFKGVVLHEFGHALGLIHEQQQPLADIPWNKEAAYAHYLKQNPNWTRAMIDDNVFSRVDERLTNYSNYDKFSIMHYSIPASITYGGFSVGVNNELSETDKYFIAWAYPRG